VLLTRKQWKLRVNSDKRKGDAKAQITHHNKYAYKKLTLAIAEFEYKQHYVLEEE